MPQRFSWFLLLFIIIISGNAFCQDVDFHLAAHLLNGQKIISVKRDFHDNYAWALSDHNQVYRINSITMAVDDYTPKFSAYSNYQFVDVRGYSADTVFVATNSTNVIQYLNGNIKLLGSNDGVPGTVNSLGIDLPWNWNDQLSNGDLTVATDKGLWVFDPKTQRPAIPWPPDWASSPLHAKTHMYNSTYRGEVFKDSTSDKSGWDSDTLHYLSVGFNGISVSSFGGGAYVGYVWIGNKLTGKNVNTVHVINDDSEYGDGYFGTYFWGTENGMFATPWDNSRFTGYNGWKTYLQGIKVNKISDIYGLVASGNNFTSYYNLPWIKQNLLIGTDQGLYYTTSIYNYSFGYPKFDFNILHDNNIGNAIINDITVNNVPDAKPICENGVWVATNNGLYYLKPDYGKYINNQQQRYVSFSNPMDTLSNMQICASTKVVAKAFYEFSNIQWYKNGVELTGQNKDTLSITEAGNYNAVLYDPCAGVHIESNHLKVTVISSPVFTFNYPDKMQYCDNTPVTLNVTQSPAYHYRWYKDGALSRDTTSSLKITQSGKYKVELSACTNSWVLSKEVEVTLINLPQPAIKTDKAAYCIGDNATLSTAAPVNANYTINWYRDNILLNDKVNQTTLTTNVAGIYTVSITSNSQNSDGTTCPPEVSLAYNLFFVPNPSVKIEASGSTKLCDGQTIILKAVHDAGSVKWSTGETTDQITVGTTGIYRVTYTNTSGCADDTSFTVNFLPNPIFSVSDTIICPYKSQPVTLRAPEGFARYVWNGVTGNETFNVTQPQIVSLTVIDANGCQATKQINVTAQCLDVEMPNTFTPNNDGINDTWNILGLDNTSLVKVYNRYGGQVYQSRGAVSIWDGNFNGQKLPQGVYYYLVITQNGSKTLSGWVSIVY